MDNQKELKKNNLKNILKNILEWIYSISFVAIIFFIIHLYFVNFSVSGESMYPTFEDKDKIIIAKKNKIDHQDVIVLKADTENFYIKRAIGLPGDKVVYKNDKLFINNKEIKEPYLNENKKEVVNKLLTENFSISSILGSEGKNTIPKNMYLVLGDNRQNSLDSRYSLGLVNKNQIVGEVIIRYYPFNQFDINFKN